MALKVLISTEPGAFGNGTPSPVKVNVLKQVPGPDNTKFLVTWKNTAASPATAVPTGKLLGTPRTGSDMVRFGSPVPPSKNKPNGIFPGPKGEFRGFSGQPD